VDESAYYELLCPRPGSTSSTGRQFVNDGTPMSPMFKAFKRGMAGEYSRDWSTKVFIGQCHWSNSGSGRAACRFGLRRMLLEHGGMPEGHAAIGEQKSLQRIGSVAGAGPDDEVEPSGDLSGVRGRGRAREPIAGA